MTTKPGINIAIDGYSSTGKSTLAKSLAASLGYRYIDTGAMYRAVTLFALRNGLIDQNNDSVINENIAQRIEPEVKLMFRFNPEKNLSEIYLNNENVEDEIRKMEVARHVSSIAAISGIRRFLVKQQQAMAREKRVVMDGRDIGTVVLPEAELKIFMTASEEVRVERRFKELQAKGQQVTKEEVARNISERDYKDTSREDSPLKRAKDALLLDNSDLTPSEQLEVVLGWVRENI